MYSGTTISNHSGNWFGVHQKVNRSSRRSLGTHTQLKHFPSLKQIQYFEGRNGPDGIKTKSPGKDEPWHYYDPFDPDDHELISLITDQYTNLKTALKAKDEERAAFEAAWLSHALVDGLTPAHHYPYEAEMEEIRGEPKETRTTHKDKLMAKGETPTETIKKTWKLHGPGGLMSTHVMFEGGVAATLAPSKIKFGNPSKEELEHAANVGIEQYFMENARKVAMLDMYEYFYRKGWTTKLARQTRNELAPVIVKTVTAGWYLALKEAGMVSSPKS